MDNRTTARTACPDAERLAEYVDHALSDTDARLVEAHLAECDTCRAVVSGAADFMREFAGAPALPAPRPLPVSRPRRWGTLTWTLAAAAAVLLGVWIVQPGRVFWGDTPGAPPELRGLVAAVALQPTRLVSGRLTGGFHYGPRAIVTRGEATQGSSADVLAAVAALEKRGSARPQDQAALGVGYLAIGDRAKAIALLQQAVALRPNDAALRNDLAVAQLDEGQFTGNADAWRAARAAADEAIRLNPTLVEPYFNRALALEGLERPSDAKQAWDEYLRHDDASAWAAEARDHAARLR